MADLDHNLSLADALTEPPPDVEEEVKRDFIATLEAEKFDDVVGETVDKTDYVPLLDDEDEAKPGSQEPKSKGHVDGIPVEHCSASGPMVVENGDHGLQGHTGFPGGIMDEKMSYKEFLDHNNSWAAEERDLCFKPMDMADSFSLHRGDNLPELAFPPDLRSVPLFPGHASAARDILAPHGSMMGPEQPFLGSLYSPAEALDPSAFMGLEAGTEFLPGKAAPEEYWMGAQQDMKAPDTSFFVEPPVPPAATEAIRTSLPESPTAAAAPGSAPEAPEGTTTGAASVPTTTTTSLPAEKAPGAAPAAAASPFQEVGFAPAPEASPPRGVNDVSSPGTELGFAPAADAASHPGLDLGFAPAAGVQSQQTMDLGFAPAADVESHHGVDLGFAPAAAGVESHHSMDLGFAPAADMESHHAMDLGFAPAGDVESHQDMDLGFAPAGDVESHQDMDMGFAPAADVEPPHALDLGFAPAADHKAQHALGSESAPAAEVNHHQALDSGFAAAAPAKPGPAVDSGHVSGEAQPVPAAAPRAAVPGELLPSEAALEPDKAPAEATAKVEVGSKVPEVGVDHSEEMKDRKPPLEQQDPGKPSQPLEPAAEAKGALENKDLPEKSAPAVNGEPQKEEAEHNHVQHTEPAEGKTLQEPTGLPTAQVRQAPKSRDRGFGRAKPAPVPLSAVPEEQPVGVPQQKSPEPRADPCPTVELGCGAGTSPRFRAPHKKATSVPMEPVESCRDPPQEHWDLESAVVKKKKKKPKQRRSQLPRGTELWEEKGTASRAARDAPFGGAWQSPAPCASHPLEEPNTLPGQQGPLPRGLGAQPRQEGTAEARAGGCWVLEGEGRSREVPSEQGGEAEGGESAPEPTERELPRENGEREDKELKVNVSKAETPAQSKPSQLLVSHRNEEPETSPGQAAPSDSEPSLETAAKKNWEKSKGVQKESLRQAHLEAAAVEDKLPAGGSKAGSEGALKTPADAPGAPVPALISPKPGEAPAVQGGGTKGVPDAPKHASRGQAGGRGVAADCPDPSQGKGGSAPQGEPGREPSVTQGGDRPRRKRSEGKGKRMKSCWEQMVLSEDGGRTDEAGKERVYPENGRGAPARGHPAASPAQACPADKPKKRGSDGRSKRGERSFFQQPFLEMEAGSFPEAADKMKEGSDKGREGGCVPAGGLQENAAKTQRQIELGPEEPKENAGKGEPADLGASAQALLLEKSREETKSPALAATRSPSEQVALAGKGRGAGGEGAGLGSGALAEKPRKRSSDGRRKEPEKSPSGQAAVLGAGGEPRQEQVAGSRKEMSLEEQKGSGWQRERLVEELGKPESQGGSGSCCEQLKTEPGRGSAEETWPVNKGKEADKSQAPPEHRELGLDEPKGKSRDGKGRKAELGPGDIPAVGHVQQTQSGKGKENSRAPAALLAHLPDPAKAPALPLEPGKSLTGGEEKHRKGEPDPQQPFLLEQKAGAGMVPPPGLEIRDKAEAGGASPCSRDKNPIAEHPAVSDPSLAPVSERSKKRGYDGSSKKAKNASRQPVPLEAKPERSEAQPPMGSGLQCAMEDTELVDENRNIKNFPTGPQRLWNNKGSDSKSVCQATASGPGDGGDAPCGLPKQREGTAGTGGLPPPPPLEAVAEKSSREPGPGAKKEMQKSREQPISLGHKEPGEELSLKDGGSREAGQPKDRNHLSPMAEDDKEINPSGKEQGTAKAPSELADPRHRAAPGTPEKGTGSLCPAPAGTPGSTGSLCPAPAGTPGSTGSLCPAPAALCQAVPGAGGAEQGSPPQRGTEPEAAQTAPKQPREDRKGPWQPAEQGPARAGEALLEDAPRGGEGLLKDAPGAKAEVEKPPKKTKEENSQAKTKEKDTQDSTKERETQDSSKERETQVTTKERETQVTAKEKESQVTKGKESQDTTKEKSQDTPKEKESQEITKEKSQDTTREKPQDTTKEKESQDTTREQQSQEVTKGKESQDTTKEKSQDTTEEKEHQEISKEKDSQDTPKEKEPQDITKEKESQDTPKEKSQDTGKAKEAQAPSTEEGREQKVLKEAKKERVKAAEQLKGYLRPTLARGGPALVARPALVGRPAPGRARGV